jgi:hypothetical protein
MTRLHTISWSLLLMLAGSSALAYLLTSVSPHLSDGQLDLPMLVLFLLALLLLVTGVGTAVALLIHRQWPSLGGSKRRSLSKPNVALRQGFLFACAIIANLLLALFQMFDLVFVLVLLLLAGLVEAYLQHRQVH